MNLTNYDKYVLNKRNEKQMTNAAVNGVNRSASDEYDNYMLDQLRRTEPSGRRIMSRDEFYAARGNTAVLTAVPVQKEPKQKEHRFHLRKGGKLILGIYVILMVVLASILIVTNTTHSDTTFDGLSFNQSAGAASSEGSESDGKTIMAMSVEEENSEETNWFDRLCDSLNK